MSTASNSHLTQFAVVTVLACLIAVAGPVDATTLQYPVPVQ